MSAIVTEISAILAIRIRRCELYPKNLNLQPWSKWPYSLHLVNTNSHWRFMSNGYFCAAVLAGVLRTISKYSTPTFQARKPLTIPRTIRVFNIILTCKILFNFTWYSPKRMPRRSWPSCRHSQMHKTVPFNTWPTHVLATFLNILLTFFVCLKLQCD